MIDQIPVGYTCPHTIVRQNSSRLCLSVLMIDQIRVSYTCPHTTVGQNSSFFYGEPHNVFLDLIFPVTVGRACMVYGDKAVYLRFVAMNGVWDEHDW